MKNNKREMGGGLKREGKLINFIPLKRGGLFEKGGGNRGFMVVDFKHFGSYIVTVKCNKSNLCNEY